MWGIIYRCLEKTMDDLQRKWSKSTLVWLRAFLQQKMRNFDNGQCTVILIVFSSKYNFWSIGWSERLATQLLVKRFVIRALDMFCHPCNICMMKMNELCWNQIFRNKSHAYLLQSPNQTLIEIRNQTTLGVWSWNLSGACTINGVLIKSTKN